MCRLLPLGEYPADACTRQQMWKGLSVVTDSPSPIVVVLSGSMEPAFQRGDLLFLWNRNFLRETDVGEVVVYNVRGKDIPIVHRVVRKYGSGLVLLVPLLVAPLSVSSVCTLLPARYAASQRVC